MKCPHCGYDDKKPPLPSESGVGLLEDGEHGVMYKQEGSMMRRSASFFNSDRKAIYGCPAPDCGKTFIK